MKVVKRRFISNEEWHKLTGMTVPRFCLLLKGTRNEIGMGTCETAGILCFVHSHDVETWVNGVVLLGDNKMCLGLYHVIFKGWVEMGQSKATAAGAGRILEILIQGLNEG